MCTLLPAYRVSPLLHFCLQSILPSLRTLVPQVDGTMGECPELQEVGISATARHVALHVSNF